MAALPLKPNPSGQYHDVISGLRLEIILVDDIVTFIELTPINDRINAVGSAPAGIPFGTISREEFLEMVQSGRLLRCTYLHNGRLQDRANAQPSQNSELDYAIPDLVPNNIV